MSAAPFLAFGGVRAPIASLTLSANLWVAELQFAGTDELPATAELTVGDLSLLGTIYRQAAFAGSRTVRVVAGYGGWHKSVASRAYTLPGGVSLSLVLGDLAKEVGEKLNVSGDHVIGDYFVREAGPAQRILRQLAGAQWYVDDDGVTRVQSRPSAAVVGDYLVNNFNGARGELVISTESYAEWRPGNTFSNALVPEPQTIGTVRIESDNTGTLRHTVLIAGPESEVDRMLQPIRELIRSELAARTFLGVYGYQVLESDGTTVTCRPANAALSLPALVTIPLRNGAAGLDCKPPVGSVVAVAFLDGDPAQPRVMGGMVPAGTSRAVVCYGDRVSGGPLTDVKILPGTTQAIEMAALPVTVKAARLAPL